MTTRSRTPCSTRRFAGAHLTRCIDAEFPSIVNFSLDRRYPPIGAPMATMSLRRRRTEKVISVESIEVHDERARRARLGTALYEVALEEACRSRRRLASDDMRSSFAEAFWRKQEAKGRAVCDPGPSDSPGGGYYGNPLRELVDARDTGRISSAEYERIRSRLPEPVRDAIGPHWPCRRFIVARPCRVEGFEGIGRR